jgi:glucan phosphorylase
VKPVPVFSGLVAYFSAEFGLAECLSIFAGGLGVLAGDHLKYLNAGRR